MKKIAVIGPESTGKSTLCEHLAQHYETVWCPEYAREYLQEHGTHYTYADLLTIAKGQTRLEDRLLTRAQNGLYIIDTEMHVMKVWCEVVFESCHTWILREIARRKYDMYLLCQTDLPWVQDELREYPDLEARQRLYNIYMEIVVNSGVPWAIVSGGEHDRVRCAVEAINSTFPELPLI